MILEPEAGEELLAAATWYDDQRPGLGDEFLSAMDEVLERVAAAPLSYPRDRFDERARRALVERFPLLARDRAKARLYAAAGVTEYWIVNLPEQVLEVHTEPGADGYAAVSRRGRGETMLLAAFEDVALGVDAVLPPTRRPQRAP